MERESKKAKTEPVTKQVSFVTAPAAALQLKVGALRQDFQFVNTSFEVSVFLQTQDGQIATGIGDLSVEVSLAFQEGADSPPPGMLVLESPGIVVNGRSSLKVCLTDVSMNVGNRKVCLSVTAAEGSRIKNKVNVPTTDISPGRSGPILVIRHKLKLGLDQSWEPKWYKDEGGRDKAISLPVQLVDAAGRMVIDREVPLTVRLRYESGAEVPNQASAIKIHETSSAVLVAGQAELKVRLEQVSRNHNHQDFQVEVHVDTDASPLDLDVGSTISPSVTVLSKRNRGGAGSSSRAPLPQQSSNEDVTVAAARAATQAEGEGKAFASTPSLNLPFPAGDGGVNGSLQNVLGWIQNSLLVMDSQSRVLEAMQAQHAALRRTISSYQERIQLDLQALVTDHETREAYTAAQPHALSLSAPPPPPGAPPPLPVLGAAGLGAPLEQPAAMMRQTSSNYFSVQGGVSVAGEAAAAAVPYAAVAGGHDPTAEADIVYIVAKLFVTSSAKAQFQEKIGFPAFGADKALIGFFRESEGSGAAGEKLHFLSLAAARAAGRLNEENVAASAHSLERELARMSKSVFELGAFTGTLDEMKAAALFYFQEKAGGAVSKAGLDDAALESLFRTTSESDQNWIFELDI